MSFQNKSFWMDKGTGCLTDSDMAYENSSRLESKRPHQWFMEGTEAELFPNKKQVLEVPSSNSFLGISNLNVSPWGNASTFHPVSTQFTERIFESETARTINFDDRNVGNINMGTKVVEDPFLNDPSFGLSISHSLEDPRSALNYGGIRKVKVSQVKDSDNIMSASLGHAYNTREDNSSVSSVQAYNKPDGNSISMGLSYNGGDTNILSVGDAYNREDNSFITMGGQTYSKGGENTIPMGRTQTYNKGNINTLLMGHTFTKLDDDALSMGHYRKGDENTISVGDSYNKVDNNDVSIGHTYSKSDDNTISMGQAYHKGDKNNNLSMGPSYNKCATNIISFGGSYEDHDTTNSGTLICSYDLLMSQPSVQTKEALKSLNEKELDDSNANGVLTAAQVTPSSTAVSKKKEEQNSKKIPPNNFPSNVRSLLSTGMLDGVPVKYMAWSREKELRGVIKGSGYLCGCQTCNFCKVINAYDFERHAGCKTKHPNNHIYFENGKTIYGIVQELRSTPQNMLFEVIQNITGSPINQKSFRLWKESFLAATRELQRIYGKDEAKQLS